MLLVDKSRLESLSPALVEPLRTTDLIVRSFLAGLDFIVHDTARDEQFPRNHLLFYLAQDLLQSAIAVITLAADGLPNVARRELRFMIETAVKLCFVEQKSTGIASAQKLLQFDKELSSQRLSIKNNLLLELLPAELRPAFHEDVGRILGLTSNYVHLTPTQLAERMAAVDAGRTAGKESPEDIEALNALISRGLACTLVLLFHSVPSWVAGDWFGENNGESVEWYFMGSRLIAGLDSYFDYKAERHDNLAGVQLKRERGVTF